MSIDASGGNGLLDIDPETAALAAEAVLVEAACAREDLSRFFGFVMREETSREPIEAVAHQRVLFSFIQHHPYCVVRMPAGSSKTFCMSAVSMFLLGHDPTVRGAVVSSTQGQAAKVVGQVGDYIAEPELAAALQLVFPNLRKSRRPQDPWTQTAITVDRPPGIRDPSLVAIGEDGKLPGSRLAWIVVDDILDRQNTSTPAGREKTMEFFDSTVLSRLDPDNSRLVVTNTPWHPDDLTYRLEKAGWPTLTMDVEGNIFITNAADDWDTDDIRPSEKPGEVYRLTDHDPDEEEANPLWELRFSRERIEHLRQTHLPHRFNQLFMCLCRDEMTAKCKLEWIDKCKRLGVGTSLVSEYKGANPTVTGVDVAVGLTTKHDKSAFVTAELLPGGKRRILDVAIGRWDGPTLVDIIIAKQKAYNSIVRVENNAAQDFILQFARKQKASVPVKAHTTGRNKAHYEYGIEGLFVEVQNGAWIIPCDRRLRPHRHVQEMVDDAMYYDPGGHTGDALMAWWLCREMARKLGNVSATRPNLGASIAARFLSR